VVIPNGAFTARAKGWRPDIARRGGLVALECMASEHGAPASGADDHLGDHPRVTSNALVGLSTVVSAELGGLYMATGSCVVTALAAVVIAVLGVCMTVRHRFRCRS
jgi:hypothetical protein